MSTMRALATAGLIAMAQAFTQPTTATWGALLTPDLKNSVTQGKTFSVTWDPSGHETDGVTVSLVLCKGPSTNCVTQSTAIVEGVPAAQKSYSWSVPCSLASGVQATETGYGMLIIVDGTGEFQYSTQFSVNANSNCASSSVTSSNSTGPDSSTPVTIMMSSTSQDSSASTATSSMTGSSSSTNASSSAAFTTKGPISMSTTSTATASATRSSTSTQSSTGAGVKLASGAFGAIAAVAVGMFAL